MKAWSFALLVPALTACSLTGLPAGPHGNATPAPTAAALLPTTDSPTQTHRTPAPTESSSPEAAPPPGLDSGLLPGTRVPFPKDLQRVWMDGASNGWAADAASNLYRTADGGASWYLASLPSGVQYIAGLSTFLDSAHGWLADYVPHVSPSLWRTTDGGLTWTHLTDIGLPAKGADPVFRFASPDDGLADLGGFGEGSIYNRLFETHDGGASFGPIPVIGPTDETGRAEGVVQYCRLCGDAFHYDPSRAILVEGGLEKPPGAVHVQQSTDLGQHWSASTLPLPAGYQDALVVALPLALFGEGRGYLPVRLLKYDANGKAYDAVSIYTTSDGGATWSLTPTVLSEAEPFTLNFSDPDAEILCGGKLCITHDGAQTWETLTPNVDFSYADTHYVQGMTFSTPLAGWIILWESPESYKLYRTVDGGSIWTLLNP